MSRPLTPALLAALLCFSVAALAPRPAGAQPVDLELSLLLDSSISVDDAKFAIEIDAVADLVEDAAVIPQDGSVALNLILYSTRAREVVPFTRVTSAADAAALASTIRAVSRTCCRTGIADGLRVATASIAGNAFEGRRKVIDVAGNGVENAGALVDLARADALRVVDTINGLPITEGEPDLLRYYQDEVIGGSGAFAYEVRTWDDFADALRAKLTREVGRCAPPLDGLAAWWAFEREQVDVECDLAGGHGAQRLGCPAHSPGRFGDALAFDGLDDALLVIAARDLAGSAGLSAVTWLRTVAAAGEMTLMDRRAADGRGWRLSLQDGRPRVIVDIGASRIDLQAPTAIADGAWHHVGFTVGLDAGAWRVDLVADGARVATGSLPQPPPGVDAVLLIGADAIDGGAAHFAGELDDVQVFGRALTATEVFSLANPPVAGQCGWSAGCVSTPLESERCLWPPNHGYTCFSDARILLGDVPAARGLPIHVIACRSSQPDDIGGPQRDRPWWAHAYGGDGNTVDDCVIAPDAASFCVRTERSGHQRQPREYIVTLTLDCGGLTYTWSTVRLIVPHDMRGQVGCGSIEVRAR